MSTELPLKIGGNGQYFFVEQATLQHDLNRVAAVINSAYKKVRYLQEGIQRITVSELKSVVSDPRKKLYLCLSPAHEICGTILLDFFEKDKAEIALFAVHPDCQRYQIGPAFMNYVEQEAFKKVTSIVLKVIPLFQERLIHFYERLGYRTTGEVMNFPEEDKIRYIRPECRDQIFFSLMQKGRAKIRSSL
jgi:ribosomal protein S18 acetylase RimI-like enzyme